MRVLLDVQSELSLPGGGCGIEVLARRARELGLHGIAVSDRRTLAAGPALVAAGAAAGIEVRIGLRQSVQGIPGLDLLLFPRVPEAWPRLAALAEREALTPTDVARAGEVVVIAVVTGEDAESPLAPAAHPDPNRLEPLRAGLRALKAAAGAHLFLALPDLPPSGPPSLRVVLGRDLDLPFVLAPPVHSVEIEDAPLHRLLVLIRGDHEGGGVTPRPGRPAALPLSATSGMGAGSLVRAQAALATTPEDHPGRTAAIALFADLLPAQSLLETATPDPEIEAAALESLQTRLYAACASRRRVPPAGALEAELAALARRQALKGIGGLLDLHRALADRPCLGVGAGWSESWVGFALGWSESAPGSAGLTPAWVTGDSPLPEVRLEMGEAGARVALGLLELNGAREPVTERRLTAAQAARWLALSRGFEPRAVRRLIAAAEGRLGPGERLPSGSRSLLALAGRLSGRVVALERAADTRVFTPFTAPARRLDRRREEAAVGGGLAVTVARDPGLTLLEHAGVGRAQLTRAAEQRVHATEIVNLLAGPLHSRSAAHLAQRLQRDRPSSLVDLARALVRARRTASAPSARLAPGAGQEECELLLYGDALAALSRLGIAGELASDLLQAAVTGQGTLLGALRSQAERAAEAAGHPAPALDAVLAALGRLGPHLVPEGPWLERAQVLAELGRLAAHEPAILTAAIADRFPDHLPALRQWASERGIVLLPPDLNASGVRSEVVSDGAARRVRLGLCHLAGVDRAAAEIVVRVRGAEPFAGREDVLRRLKKRLPSGALRLLLGEDLGPEGHPRKSSAATERISHRAASPASSGGELGGGNRMQFDLFGRGQDQAPRIYTAALARLGIVALDRGAAAVPGSRIRTVGVLQPRNMLVARSGRRMVAARLSDQGTALELLMPPEVIESVGGASPARPVVVDGRMADQEGKGVLWVERVVPLELLADVDLPGITIQLPAGFRRVRALRLRILKSPGRSPLCVRPPASDRALGEWATLLSKLAVTLDEALLADLSALVGEGHVFMTSAAHLGPAIEAGSRPETAPAAGAA